MAEHNDLGKLGEEMAVAHLVKNGYNILELNWKYGKEEIDIIAQKNGWVIFAEVKTRTFGTFETAASAVNRKKQKQIIHVADKYFKHKNLNLNGRFDIIFILHNEANTQLDHMEDAFYATL